MEPFRLRRWKVRLSDNEVVFFTCARPGRSKKDSKGRTSNRVSDDVVNQWVNRLPGGDATTIISLLGRKHGPAGESEFAFYSFCGEFDTVEERSNRATFQEWLDRHHPERSIQVLELPTFDYQPVDDETLKNVGAALDRLASSGRTVILMDSGGETRTGYICRRLGAKEETGTRDDRHM